MYRFSAGFGALNAVLAILWLLGLPVIGRTAEGWLSVALMQLVVGVALLYASVQKSRQTIIGQKTFPATIVAYGLWLLIFLRWLNAA